MKNKLILLSVFLFLILSISVYARYQVSIPFQVDSGGNPVATATVGINISEGTNCVSPFYFNKTTAQYGRGQINVTSPRFIASRVYTLCFNSTVGSNVLKGRTTFTPGVGDINVTTWVNGSKAGFSAYRLINGSTFDVIYGRQDGNATPSQIRNVVNVSASYYVYRLNTTNSTTAFRLRANRYVLLNGSTFDVIYGRQDGNVTPTGITNIIYNGTGIKLMQAFNGTLIKLITAFNGTLAKISQVYNGTLTKRGIQNNTDQGKVYINSSNGVFVNATLQARKFTLANGSTFDVIYGRDNNNQTLADLVLVNGTSARFRRLNATERLNVLFANITHNITARRYFLSNGSVFDVIYGARPDGNVTPAQLTAFVYNGTLARLTVVYNGTLAKAAGDIRNNTDGGKVYLNYSNGAFFNGTITVRKILLSNGSTFDVIYGRNNQTLAKNILKNNTNLGRIYLNTSRSNIVINDGWINITTNNGLGRSGIMHTANSSNAVFDFWCNGSVQCTYGWGHFRTENSFNIRVDENGKITFLPVGAYILPVYFDMDTYPNTNNAYNLGNNTKKWKLISSVNINATRMNATTFRGKSYLLDNGSNFDAIYGVRGGSGTGNFSSPSRSNLTFDAINNNRTGDRFKVNSTHEWFIGTNGSCLTKCGFVIEFLRR